MIALKIYPPTEHIEQPSKPQRLRDFYTDSILPEIRLEQSPNSLREDRTALNHWERLTGDPPLVDVTQEHIAQLRDGFIAEGLSPATANKYWRELRAMFNWAVEDGIINRSPQISRRSKSRLMKAPPKRQRETLTLAEVSALYHGCRKATYPSSTEIPAPKLWRTAIVLWHYYGARTMDFLQHLTWDNVLWSDRLLKFTAQKTSKLQGLPLTDLVIAHLQSIKRQSHQVFPGFKAKGCFLKKKNAWKRGYYTTWRNEIQRDASLSGILIKHFRETMVTRNNGIEAGLGAWVAGHYMPGVTAQSYDLPTQRIREAVESTPVPDCFHELD